MYKFKLKKKNYSILWITEITYISKIPEEEMVHVYIETTVKYVYCTVGYKSTLLAQEPIAWPYSGHDPSRGGSTDTYAAINFIEKTLLSR